MFSGSYGTVCGRRDGVGSGVRVPPAAAGELCRCQNFQTRFSCMVSNDGVPVAFSKSTQRIR
jgi:hypothetical protein